jgi:hypothetical protein
MLIGSFCGDNHCLDYTPTNISNINYLKIDNGIFDEVFATNNVTSNYLETSKKWDFDTVFYALFQNNLFAGNVSFTADTVSAMRIKRRKSSEYKWITLFEIPISTNADFSFERFDRYVRGKTDYEYSLVPVINSVEGNLSSNSIKSEFEGFYFIDKDTIIRALLNTKLSTQRNQNSTTISTLGRKYPYQIVNGDNNYVSGSLECTFIDLIDCEFDVDNGWSFRDVVDDFLTNGKPKILKNDEGKIWIVAIVDAISQDFSNHYQMPIHTINFVETGNAEDMESLFNSNLSDVDPTTL